jgi:hypothetical protein
MAFSCLPSAWLLLEVVLLTRHALRLAFADNLLAEPLRLEALLQHLEVLDDVLAALDDGVLRGDGAVGRDAKLEGREERMGDLVCGEDNEVILEEALGEEIAKRVVFLVEGEDGGVGDACVGESVGRVWRGCCQWARLTGLLLVLDFRLAVV